MFYRRKIILAALEHFARPISSTEIQKLLFIISRKQEKKTFHFVPYKYGCYSFQIHMDLNTMVKKELIEKEGEGSKITWAIKASDSVYFNTLKDIDKKAILSTKRQFGDYSVKELIEYTYQKYAYYAINSTILDKVLPKENQEHIQKQRKKLVKKDTVLFTIGYEGISLEQYVNKLIINDVKLLCDVRKNSFSMKYGFSKKQLKNACEFVNIEYIHMPELGIVSEKRKTLKTFKDYEVLFEEYEKTVLKDNTQALNEVESLLENKNRIALTCFEAQSCMCHRGRVAKALQEKPTWDYEVKHL